MRENETIPTEDEADIELLMTVLNNLESVVSRLETVRLRSTHYTNALGQLSIAGGAIGAAYAELRLASAKANRKANS